MARNEEKALTLFSKWTAFKKDYHSNVTDKRPFIASECDNVAEAEKWRRELIRDITKKISQIANGTLGEHRIREMNDEINKMMRQKHHWEIRIRELGGDVLKGRQFYDIDGKELPGAPGYKYYGAAKQLPGVRELFAENEDEFKQRKQKRTRVDMYKNITPDYYGYRDDDDGILVIKESQREKELITQAEEEYLHKKAEIIKLMQLNSSSNSNNNIASDDLLYLQEDSDEEELQEITNTNVYQTNDNIISSISNNNNPKKEVKVHVELPSQDDINELLLVEKRKALLEKLTLL